MIEELLNGTEDDDFSLLIEHNHDNSDNVQEVQEFTRDGIIMDGEELKRIR